MQIGIPFSDALNQPIVFFTNFISIAIGSWRKLMFHLFFALLLARTGTILFTILPFLLSNHLADIRLDPTLQQGGRFPNLLNFLTMTLISLYEIEIRVEIWQNGASGVHAYLLSLTNIFIYQRGYNSFVIWSNKSQVHRSLKQLIVIKEHLSRSCPQSRELTKGARCIYM